MQDFVDQENTRRDRELAGALKRQIRRLQLMRWLVALAVIALCGAMYAVDGWLEKRRLLLALGIGIGLVGGLHFAALRQQPLLYRVIRQLDRRSDMQTPD